MSRGATSTVFSCDRVTFLASTIEHAHFQSPRLFCSYDFDYSPLHVVVASYSPSATAGALAISGGIMVGRGRRVYAPSRTFWITNTSFVFKNVFTRIWRRVERRVRTAR